MRFLFIFFSIFFVLCTNTKGSHIVGGNLHYEHLGNDLYEVSLHLYKDCGLYYQDGNDSTLFTPAQFPPIFQTGNPPSAIYARLFIYSNSYNDSIYFTSIDTIDIPVNNPNPCLQVTEDLCIKRGVYKVQITLPSIPGGYHLSFQYCCRNINTTNLDNPFNTGITIPTFLPERNEVGDNSNPVFQYYPPLVICQGESISIPQMATDADGDILEYSLANPLKGDEVDPDPPPYQSVDWDLGYSASNPVVGSPGLAIDQYTGVLTGTPTQLGSYVVGIMVKEFRNGVVISETLRDFRFLVTNCNLTEAIIPQHNQVCNGLTVDFYEESDYANIFFWDFGDESVSTDTSSLATPSYTYPNNGIYSVMLIANPGMLCVDTTFVSFLLDDELHPKIDSVPDQCFEDNSYDFSFTGFYPDSTFIVWDFGPNATPQVDTGANPQGIHFSSEVEQMVIVTLFLNSCENSDTLFFLPQPAILAVPLGPIHGCDSLDLILQPSPYNAIYTYDWIIDTDTFLNTDFPSVLLGPGQYDVQLATTSPLDCYSEFFQEDYITIHQLPIAGFNFTDTIFEEGDLIEMVDESVNTTGVEYIINGTDYLNDNHFIAGESGTYTVTQIVDNPGQCPDELTKEIEIENHYAIVFPNVFSPNGDNMNDYFNPKHFKVKSYTLKVFDRWGKVVFYGDKPETEHRWYGDRINGDLADQAVYYYQCVFTTNRNEVFEHEGTVTLIK